MLGQWKVWPSGPVIKVAEQVRKGAAGAQGGAGEGGLRRASEGSGELQGPTAPGEGPRFWSVRWQSGGPPQPPLMALRGTRSREEHCVGPQDQPVRAQLGLCLPSPPGALSHEEEVAPLAGPSLPPSPCGPSHVHPHVAHTDQLPQHQADGRCVTPRSPRLAHHSTFGTASPASCPALLAVRALVGTEERAETSSPAWQDRGCTAVHGAARNRGQLGPRPGARGSSTEKSQEPPRRAGHTSSGIRPRQPVT